jgi:hypothetical protein
MLLMKRLGGIVDYNFLYLKMQKPFVTGLKLRNSLTSQLVRCFLARNSSSLKMAEMSNGIHVDQLYILTAIWAMQGTNKLI